MVGCDPFKVEVFGSIPIWVTLKAINYQISSKEKPWIPKLFKPTDTSLRQSKGNEEVAGGCNALWGVTTTYIFIKEIAQ